MTSARAAEHGSPGTSSDRLQRLLALVPYVISRKVVGLAETAAAFGVSERELTDDLNMLWCVELRTPDPYCPIDLSYEGGEIVISQAEPVDRPLRAVREIFSSICSNCRTTLDCYRRNMIQLRGANSEIFHKPSATSRWSTRRTILCRSKGLQSIDRKPDRTDASRCILCAHRRDF